jgi:hypothetical protein
MTDNALVFVAKDGLGNRLRALVGFLALAEFQQAPMLLHWPRDGACDAEFTDLFEITGWEDVRLIDAEEAVARKASHPERYYYSSVWFTEIWQQYAQSLCTREAFSQVAIKHLRALRPRQELISRVEEFAQAHNLDQCTGLHIRMTDNVHAYDWWIKNDPHFVPEKVSRLDGFEAVIRESVTQNKGVFLCTDNQEISHQLRIDFSAIVMYQKAFDDQGFVHHVSTYYDKQGRGARLLGKIKSMFGIHAPTSWRTTDVTDALIEMLLLARCQRVIGTYYSSFSQVAALIGGVPLYRMEGNQAVENLFICELRSA